MNHVFFTKTATSVASSKLMDAFFFFLSLKQVASAIPQRRRERNKSPLDCDASSSQKTRQYNLVNRSIQRYPLWSLPLYYHQQYSKRPNPAFLNSFTLSISAP
jgi:hypothetical protein